MKNQGRKEAGCTIVGVSAFARLLWEAASYCLGFLGFPIKYVCFSLIVMLSRANFVQFPAIVFFTIKDIWKSIPQISKNKFDF